MTQEQISDVNPSTNAETQFVPEIQQPAEKMVNLPQSQIDHAFKVAKSSAYEKGKQEALKEYQGQNTSQGMSQEEFDRRVSQATQKHIEEVKKQFEQDQINSYTQRVAHDFLSRIESAKDEHPELNDFARSGALGGFPNTVMLSMEVDNTPDLVAEFKEHPSKMVIIENLIAKDPSGTLARQEMKKISESIKANKSAKQRQTPNQPLSHIKPSNVGVDNGSVSGATVSDLRKMFR